METLEQLQKTIDNAPSGASHWDKMQYFRIRFNDSSLNIAWDVFNQGSGKWNSVGGMYLTDVYKIRSLSDIKRIIGLEKKLAAVRVRLDFNPGIKCSDIPDNLAM